MAGQRTRAQPKRRATMLPRSARPRVMRGRRAERHRSRTALPGRRRQPRRRAGTPRHLPPSWQPAPCLLPKRGLDVNPLARQPGCRIVHPRNACRRRSWARRLLWLRNGRDAAGGSGGCRCDATGDAAGGLAPTRSDALAAARRGRVTRDTSPGCSRSSFGQCHDPTSKNETMC